MYVLPYLRVSVIQNHLEFFDSNNYYPVSYYIILLYSNILQHACWLIGQFCNNGILKDLDNSANIHILKIKVKLVTFCYSLK